MPGLQVLVLNREKIPEDAILSIRAGQVRRQAPIASGKALRFPAEIKENLLKMDILQNIGTAYVVLKPGTLQYKVNFKGSAGEDLGCEVSVQTADGEAAADRGGAATGEVRLASGRRWSRLGPAGGRRTRGNGRRRPR
mmetsp:Transcript_44075/g.116553  ORF Transcript_44075/g.116553 Transcript_44075/m.116553 type:complete len:138 (-) Transcript_44075:653-1066(-)